MVRTKKFNNGAGAILCGNCRAIIKEGFYSCPWSQAYCKQQGLDPEKYLITDEDWESDEPIYCAECLETLNKTKNNGKEKN